MKDLERLIDIESIKNLKARYFRAIDEKNWELLRAVFHDDVELDYRGAATDAFGNNLIPDATVSVVHGADEGVKTVSGSLVGIRSVHHGHMPEIEIISKGLARAIWPMYDLLIFPPESAISTLVGHGQYFEEYLKVAGDWKIRKLRLKRFHVNVTKK